LVLERVYSAITKDKQIPRSLFMGIPSIEMTFIRHFFDVNGVVKVSNEWEDSFAINPPKFGVTVQIELYEDSENDVVAYHITAKDVEIWVYFRFRADLYKVKISIEGTIPTAGKLKIPLTSAKTFSLKAKCLMFGTHDWNTEEFLSAVGFDWNDVAVNVSFDDVNKDVVFDVQRTFSIDPSTVGTSTTDRATWAAFQRKSFYASGRFWVFYGDGSNMVFRSSTDGSTWSDPTTVRAAGEGRDFSTYFDGTYVHYAYATGTSGGALTYRRGTPNSDGTITWSADEQTAYQATGEWVFYPSVTVDSNGYAWIGFLHYDAAYHPYVTKSGNNDGTWGTTPSGFPYELTSATSSNNWHVSIITLTSAKMLAIYAYSGATIIAKRWDGSSWGSEVATTSAIVYGQRHSAVAQGDNVHLVFCKVSTYPIIHTEYVYTSDSFSSETTVQSNIGSSGGPVLSRNTANNDLYCFWAGSPTAKHIYYKKRVNGTWDTDPTDWITESDSLTGNDRLTCFYTSCTAKIGLIYMTKTASPYNIRFDFLTMAGGQTYEIFVDSVAGCSGLHAEKCAFEMAKDSSVVLEAFEAAETRFNVLKDAVAHALASVLFGMSILKDAIIAGSAAHSIQLGFTIPKETILKAVSDPSIQSIFNLSQEAVVRVFAEVSVLKEGEVKVTKLFLMLGDLCVQITGD